MIAEATPTEAEKPTTCPECGAELVGVVMGQSSPQAVCLLHPFDHVIDQSRSGLVPAYYPPLFLGTRAPIAKKNRRLTAWEKKHASCWSIVETIDEDGYPVIRARYTPPDDAPDHAHRPKRLNGNGEYRTRYQGYCETMRGSSLTPKPFDEWLAYLKSREAK